MTTHMLAHVSLQDFVAASPIPITCVDDQGNFLLCNNAFHALTQHLVEDDASLTLPALVKEAEREVMIDTLKRSVKGETLHLPQTLELNLREGATIAVAIYISPLYFEGQPPLLLLQFIDTTEQKELEVKFAHSQKMQAVGQLAGGVAHDFNNLLTAMIGFCDLLLMRHPAGDQSFADIMQIKQNANRAANLVRQLLAFSRRQTLQPKLLDITDVLAELSNLVRRLIGENITLKMNHGRDLGMVRADQGQLEQVVINLAVNARDAMKDGGTLTLRSSSSCINEGDALPRGYFAPAEEDANLPPGEYVLVEIEDTGTGIPQAILQQIFEPFFSTKEVGAGTGLGLATVYGIIKQTGGYVFVSSRENEGTTFHLYFPAQQPELDLNPDPAEIAEKPGTVDLTGRSTILLVEDETPVRIFAGRALRNKGYTVLEADSGETALSVMQEHGGEVELIVTDVIMPGMNGPTMIEKVLETYPDVKVVFISGYAEDVFVHSYGTERSFNFLAKPFTLKQLAQKVKDVLGGK